MTYAVSRSLGLWQGAARVASLCGVAGIALLVAFAPASAQEKKAAPAPAAGAAPKANGKAAEKRTQWVKLCDKIKVGSREDKDKDGKPDPSEEKELCSTMFEAIESNTGQVIVSVGLQQIAGAPRQVLAVMVPLGVVIPGGVKLAVYNADQWAKAAKNETIELKDLKTADLKFAHCLPVGCTAETQATPELVELLKSSAGLAVLAIWANGNQFTVPVSLAGFGDALGGKPLDNKEYQANRQKLMQQIQARQAQMREKMKAEQMKNLPPMPGDAAKAVPPAKAPAKQ